MSTIKSLEHQNVRDVIMTQCLGKAGLAEGTNAATIKTVTAFDYSVDGILATKAITDNIAVSSAVVQAANTDCMYLITIAGGVVTATKGVEAAAGGAVYLPTPPVNQAVIGAIKVVTTAAFTLGTTDLGAGTVTDTYFDLTHDTQAAF